MENKKGIILGEIKKYFIYFVLFSIIGWLYEVFLELFIYNNGFVNRGFLFGPYCPVYGFGAIIFILALNKLKKNGFMPISVTQVQVGNRKANNLRKKQKKNVETSGSILKELRDKQINSNTMTKAQTFRRDAKRVLFSNIKITNRDIVIFTQDFYLLKKANFNNIHALSTIIENTENPSFKAIIEDILLGVESGENMYTTMEYYAGVFPPIYINMIKVGELSRIIN